MQNFNVLKYDFSKTCHKNLIKKYIASVPLPHQTLTKNKIQWASIFKFFVLCIKIQCLYYKLGPFTNYVSIQRGEGVRKCWRQQTYLKFHSEFFMIYNIVVSTINKNVSCELSLWDLDSRKQWLSDGSW
jgi:hypothetical protein